MVRLVFRPYTQVRRTICTSESLRASTRVSPGFTLLRHSSPSFGSQQICSHSNLYAVATWSVDGAPLRAPTSALEDLHFHCALGFATQTLAYMLDSLVRVSRRDGDTHLAKTSTALERTGNEVPSQATLQAVLQDSRCLRPARLPRRAVLPRSGPR